MVNYLTYLLTYSSQLFYRLLGGQFYLRSQFGYTTLHDKLIVTSLNTVWLFGTRVNSN